MARGESEGRERDGVRDVGRARKLYPVGLRREDEAARVWWSGVVEGRCERAAQGKRRSDEDQSVVS